MHIPYLCLKRRYFLLLLLASVFFTFIYSLLQYYSNKIHKRHKHYYKQQQQLKIPVNNKTSNYSYFINNSQWRLEAMKRKVQHLSAKFKNTRAIFLENDKPNNELIANNVHIFYYAWYGNKEYDGSFKHWDHSYIANWRKDEQKIYPTGMHKAPDDIASNYYPSLGCYSSRDPAVLALHMKQIADSGIGVVVVSWSPPKFPDSPNELLELLFTAAAKEKLKIALHVEPYKGRNPINLSEHLKSFLLKYGNHSALFKTTKLKDGTKRLPVFYVYDSYLINEMAWREILSKKGNLSIRNSNLDAIFIGLLADLSHRSHIKKSAFDGFYTYFASNGFTYGSTWKNWKSLAKFATQNGLMFVPSVGAGYIDTQVRSWNSGNIRHRRHGQYYDVAWRSALNNNVKAVSITSFNEWHEGTQIEPAQSKSTPTFTYLDYEPEGSTYYLNLTKFWIQQFIKTIP